MESTKKAEMHSFDADEGYTGEWGVWEHESCVQCGRRIIVVAPLHALPATIYCKACDPHPSGPGLAG